jgi:hypothetical protein
MFDPDQRSILLDYLVFIGRRSWLTPQMGLEGSPEARQFMGCNVRPNTSPHQFFWSLTTQHASQGRVGKDTRSVPLHD